MLFDCEPFFKNFTITSRFRLFFDPNYNVSVNFFSKEAIF